MATTKMVATPSQSSSASSVIHHPLSPIIYFIQVIHTCLLNLLCIIYNYSVLGRLGKVLLRRYYRHDVRRGRGSLC